VGRIFKRMAMGTRSRSRKTAGALYRLLRDEFESRRPGCSCTMPMVVGCEKRSENDANWCVERLWCGSASCQQTLCDLVEDKGRRFELVESGVNASSTAGDAVPAGMIARLFES
jgi:hypothetical protein